ncbi:NHL repeatcontaining protein [Acanthamoeba castellanii str. Neff]|uniref:NHL repeatcontaining protein n=1 Tax=Acanthamoeba castellanii (strain ATCC 30010 / Neff) TaxID=1257118 RepID=L8GRZ6_ACACF|nr:NHL repeatcontaining protein [Acanthamoeba castellanii str. Neff]ELR15755.1 NHL repeatcontaining protein [Acanthamoeba castellanii str. Neff]
MWCERDGVAVCMVCLVAGPHKGHDALTIEEAEERAREAARVELAQVELAMGEVEAAVERQAAREAAEQESGREARAAIKQHFDRVREAVAQRERVLGAEVNDGGPSSAQRPADVAVDAATGNIIVADRDNHRVHVWQADGSFLRTFGSRGRGHGQFRRPEGVAVDVAGNVIVADYGNHRVQVWRATGRSFLRTLGSLGGGPAQFKDPRGVAVDAATGHIIVADCGN